MSERSDSNEERAQGYPLYDDLRYPGHGMPPRHADRQPPIESWARLAKDQGLGKKTNFLYDASFDGWQYAADSIFELRGGDLDANPLTVTLLPPAAIPRELADLGIDLQNQSGEFGSAELGAGNYPGLATPIAWPPFSALLKWGTGGCRAQAIIDYVVGTTINITASAVDLRAAVAPDAIAAPGTSGLYTLAAFISPGWTRPGNAQRTVYVGTLADADDESAIFVVPPFAKRATVVGCDAAGGSPVVTVATLRFWQSPDGTKNVGNFFVNGNQPIPFTVPNAGMYFSVVSGQDTSMLYSVIFDLSI